MRKRDARRQVGKLQERDKLLHRRLRRALSERNTALAVTNEKIVRIAVSQLKSMKIEHLGYVEGMKRRGMIGHERHGLVAAAMLKQAAILEAALASGEFGPEAVNLDTYLRL